MAKRLTDEEHNLKRKARRRLIGAIALTLVVVVVLPMVLDSEPMPTGQDIELRIPDPEKAGAFIPGVPVSELAIRDGDAASQVMPAELKAIGGEAVDAAPLDAPKIMPDKIKAEVNQSEKPKVSVKPDSMSSESYVAQVGAYSSADTAKQELSKLKKWGFKAYTEKSGDTIRVRVGPYVDREKAEKVRQMLEKHGLKPVVMSLK